MMSRIKQIMNSAAASNLTALLVRLAAGVIFIPVGGMKLFGWFGLMPGGPVPLVSEMGLAGILEVFGGAAIMLGLYTRPVAFILSGEMAVAYWQGHAPHGPLPILNHGEPAFLLCFLYLYLAVHGAGAWSLDGWLRHAMRVRTSEGEMREFNRSRREAELHR